MKNKIFLVILLFIMFPCIRVNAADYTLKSGKAVKGSYNETDYNYYKIQPSKNGYIAITSKTSNGSSLLIDICDKNKETVASNIKIKNKQTVFHTAKKGNTYYLKIKGIKGATYSISYKINTMDTLEYAKKYNYTFTNASFYNQDHAIVLKMKAKKSGIIHFMCNCDDTVVAKYLDSNKKIISMSSILNKNSLTGIGVQSGKTYYIKLWKPEQIEEETTEETTENNTENITTEDTTTQNSTTEDTAADSVTTEESVKQTTKKSVSGTTTISNLKYQIDQVSLSNHKSRAKAQTISQDKYVNTLVPAGKTTTTWYKVKTKKKKKLSITVESHMLQNNGKFLQLYICNAKGKKLNKNAIIIDKEATSKYKNKKYIMVYPKITFSTTAVFPPGTYYLKVESKTKTSSGSYKIKWK